MIDPRLAFLARVDALLTLLEADEFSLDETFERLVKTICNCQAEYFRERRREQCERERHFLEGLKSCADTKRHLDEWQRRVRGRR